MSALIALRAVFGQHEANHGTRRYHVDGDGLLHVPAEAALFLVSKGGFAVAKTNVAQVPGDSHPLPLPEDARSATDPNSLVRLHHDEAAGCSHGGYKYRSDENGDVFVPAEAAADLMAHGFAPATQDRRLKKFELGPKPIGRERSPVGETTSTAAPAARG